METNTNVFDVRCSRCDEHLIIETIFEEEDFENFICDDCNSDY